MNKIKKGAEAPFFSKCLQVASENVRSLHLRIPLL